MQKKRKHIVFVLNSFFSPDWRAGIIITQEESGKITIPVPRAGCFPSQKSSLREDVHGGFPLSSGSNHHQATRAERAEMTNSDLV